LYDWLVIIVGAKSLQDPWNQTWAFAKISIMSYPAGPIPGGPLVPSG